MVDAPEYEMPGLGTVRAVRLASALDLDVADGTLRGQPGDYLIQRADGTREIVRGADFDALATPLGRPVAIDEVVDYVIGVDDVVRRAPGVRPMVDAFRAGRQIGDLTLGSVEWTYDPSRARAQMHVQIHNAEGDVVGSAIRSFGVDGDGRPYAHHDLLRIQKDYRGGGFARALLLEQDAAYRAAGIQYIELDAGLEVGKYAWARSGYDYVDPADLGSAKARIELAVLKVDPGVDPVVLARALDGIESAADVAAFRWGAHTIDGNHVGKHVLLDGPMWEGRRSLDPDSLGYQLGQAYARGEGAPAVTAGVARPTAAPPAPEASQPRLIDRTTTLDLDESIDLSSMGLGTVRAQRLTDAFEVRNPDGVELGQPGDYVIQTAAGERYLLSADLRAQALAPTPAPTPAPAPAPAPAVQPVEDFAQAVADLVRADTTSPFGGRVSIARVYDAYVARHGPIDLGEFRRRLVREARARRLLLEPISVPSMLEQDERVRSMTQWNRENVYLVSLETDRVPPPRVN